MYNAWIRQNRLEFSLGSTLSKKRNATEFTVVIFSLLLTGPVVLGDSFIRHVIDLFDVFIQAEQHNFQCVIYIRFYYKLQHRLNSTYNIIANRSK